jgi:hypothetical protein
MYKNIIDQMNDFRPNPENTLESDAIARSLCVRIRSKSETKIIMGGILARYQYDLRYKTEPHFLNTRGLNLIASEAGTSYLCSW